VVPTDLNLEIKDTVFDPASDDTKRVGARRDGKTLYYKVFLYLDGPDLSLVESVTYTLHKTFRDPVRTIRRTPSNPTCQLVIWTWGVFSVKADIVDKRGLTFRLSHFLRYESELPSDDGKYDYDRPTLVSA